VLRADGGSTLAIERLTVAGGKGTLTGSGALEFRDGLVPTADVRLDFDRFLAVDRPVVEASCTGTLRVRDRLTAPTVRGKLYVPEGAVRPAFLPAANARTEPDPTIEVIGLPDAAPVPSPASLGQLTLGLTLTLGNGMRIRRRDADIRLGGTLRIERTPPEPLRVRGTVKVEDGWYTFSGRRFTLRPGAVRFDGGPVDDAELDIEATRRAGEYDVTVAVQGTVAKPELLLSSDPPLDEPDVLAVLLVGRPSGELNDSERLSVQAEAASLAVGYVVPGLSGALEEALPLEQVQVSPEAVSVGHRIGNDVFISLSQQFVGWAGQTMAVEYTITPRLSVELSTSSRGSGAIDFFWRRRY
jgi:translocation and assembly module TamB